MPHFRLYGYSGYTQNSDIKVNDDAYVEIIGVKDSKKCKILETKVKY